MAKSREQLLHEQGFRPSNKQPESMSVNLLSIGLNITKKVEAVRVPTFITLAFAILVYAAWYFGEADPTVTINSDNTFSTNKPAHSQQVAKEIELALGYKINLQKCDSSIITNISKKVNAGSHSLPNNCSIPKNGVAQATRNGERRPENTSEPVDLWIIGELFGLGLASTTVGIGLYKVIIHGEKRLVLYNTPAPNPKNQKNYSPDKLRPVNEASPYTILVKAATKAALSSDEEEVRSLDSLIDNNDPYIPILDVTQMEERIERKYPLPKDRWN